jgi:ADP-ribose pyrophosphatase YjhB (NUDIX family)
MGDDLARRSTRRFEELRGRLFDGYGDAPVVEKTWRHPPGFYDDLVERFEADAGGGAGAWVYDADGRVLLVDEGGAYSDPGGKRRPGESFPEAARRATREATGAEVSLTGLLELHRVSVYDGTDPDRPTLVEPIAVFHARCDAEGDPPVADRVDVEWFAEHPPNAGYEDVERRPIPFDPER